MCLTNLVAKKTVAFGHMLEMLLRDGREGEKREMRERVKKRVRERK